MKRISSLSRLSQDNHSIPESLLVPKQDGTVLIPIKNFGESTVTLSRTGIYHSFAELPKPKEFEKCFTVLITTAPKLMFIGMHHFNLKPVLQVEAHKGKKWLK